MSLAQFLSKQIVKLSGWKFFGAIPPGVKKCVLIVAPHTSNWDFFIGYLCFILKKIDPKILIKKELFFFPLSLLMKKKGYISVDRDKRNNLIQFVADEFFKRESLVILITPEGTRKKNPHWKKGFYHIALLANVPIVLGYLDYAKKEGGIGGILYPSGNFKDDFAQIEAFYRTKNAKYPKKFNLSVENSVPNNTYKP